MYQLVLEKRVIKFISSLPPKHQEQVKKSILSMQEVPNPHDSKSLKGYEPYRRCDCGEYRVIYRIAEQEKTIYILLVGKRNGGEVYQQLKNLF